MQKYIKYQYYVLFFLKNFEKKISPLPSLFVRGSVEMTIDVRKFCIFAHSKKLKNEQL